MLKISDERSKNYFILFQEVSSHLCSVFEVYIDAIEEISQIWTENGLADSEIVENRSEYECSAINESCKFSDIFKFTGIYLLYKL